MKRSRRTNRSDLRTGLRSLFGSRRAKTASAADLARTAGSLPDQAFEALENRQLLFTLTITPADVDPFTGVGTVQIPGPGFFDYYIPQLLTTVQPQQAQPQQPITEDFNQDFPGPPPAVINSGLTWQTGFRITHTATNVRLNQVAQGANNLAVAISGGQFVEWEWFGQGQNQAGALPMRNLQVTIGGPNGLDFANTTVELLDAAGNVITTYSSTSNPPLSAVSNTGNPIGTFNFQVRRLDGTVDPEAIFSKIRFRRNQGAPAAAYTMDDLSITIPQGRWAQVVDNRRYSATAVFTGPAGATAQFLDLYGRDMVLGFLGIPTGAQIELGDLNDNGIPDVNDGIGKIILSGVNSLSAITLIGGKSTLQDGFTLVATPMGNFDDMEQTGGFGFDLTPPPQPHATGLPPGPGSVIIGSPWVRALDNYNPAGLPPGVTLPVSSGFLRADQGVFVTGGASMGSVYLHAMVFGSSQYSGSVDRISVGVQMGSVSVAGDLGGFINGGDAGLWVRDDGAVTRSTNAQFNVGRTLGEMDIGGRSFMNVSVTGDLGNPAAHPARDVFRYFEKEWSAQIPLTAQPVATLVNILNNTPYIAINHSFGDAAIFFGRISQSSVFGDSYLENDTIMGAEFVGSPATAVQINGELGANDPVQTREDPSDVYAFPVDGTHDVTVTYSGPFSTVNSLLIYARIVDQDGRTVAAPEFIANDRRREVGLRFRPSGPGVYYLVVQTAGGANGTVPNFPYVITLSGMAPVSFGAYRSGSGTGDPGVLNNITVLSGAMGSLRVGTGYVQGSGGDASPTVIYNARNNITARQQAGLNGSTVTVASTLYNFTSGADIGALGTPFLNINGNLGTINTGLNGVWGATPLLGDLLAMNLTVAGSIGMFDIRGGLGIQTEPQVTPKPPVGSASIVVRTGTNPQLRGDVGMIRVGYHAGGGTFVLRTPNNSSVGGFLVSQDVTEADGNIYNGIEQGLPGTTGEDIRLGLNSDLRFFDSPRIWQQQSTGVFTALAPNTPQIFTDDGGGQFRIAIEGDTATGAGRVTVLPVTGSLGGAVGRIQVDLSGGATLHISSIGNTANAVVSIGRIQITNSDANSKIVIDGPTQVDVWRIEQRGGTAFDSITNATPNGDIVAIDMAALNNLTMGSGDLGRTQVPAWGPQRISPFLGITGDQGGDVNGPIGIPQAAMTGWWNGELYRPVNQSNSLSAPSSWADDVGSPVDPYLDGLIVRTGNINSVSGGGAIGDVIAAAGDITGVAAHSGGTPPAGHFAGIIGTIYANRIAAVNIGDGLAQRDPAPLSTTGIFANDDIGSVVGTQPGAFISSTIDAANLTPNNADATTPFTVDGIGTVSLTGGGSYVDAFIGSMNLDDFWTAWPGWPDDGAFAGNIGAITGAGANLFRSTVIATNINTVALNNGFFDASTLDAAGDVQSITAAGYRNSTATGGDLEFHLNQIQVGGNLGILTTFGRTGDIDDLTVSVLSHTGEISANNISRSSLSSVQSLELLQTVNDIRGTSVATGLLTSAIAGRSIRSSTFDIAGPIIDLRAVDAITNTQIRSTGPDGRIDHITAATALTGSIYAAGNIDTIEVTNGDMSIQLTTVVNQRGDAGNVKMLRASRDLDLRTDIAGTVDSFVAGRHLGNQFRPGVILVHGDVQMVDVSGGQLYADLRIGQVLHNAVIGAAFNFPGGSNIGSGSITAFGRIETVTINGDFGGKIISDSGGIGVVTINNGSLVPGGLIAAYSGTLNNVIINNGHLLGDVHADFNILSIRLNGSADGVFGDIGINPNLSAGTAVANDPHRNQLPPGVIANSSIQGPRITAGMNIGRIIVTNGSIFEAFIWAGRAIGTIDVTGDITKDGLTSGQATVIAAGSSIFTVHATGNITDTIIMAGIRGFGDDGLPGGTGSSADAVQSGRITTIHGDGAGNNVTVVAGMLAGNDGVYATSDDLVALGISYVREVTFGGAASAVTVFADSQTLTVSPGVVRGGNNAPTADPDLNDGSPAAGTIVSGTPFNFTWNGVSGTILLAGPGSVFWDQSTGRVLLVNTKLTTDLTVTANGTLTNFSIVSNDDASMGIINVQANLAGTSKIVVDAYVLGIQTGALADNSAIRVGMNVRSITTGPITGGAITAAYWARDIVIAGDFGTPSTADEATMTILAGNSITIQGNDSALIDVERDLASFAVNGAMNRAQFRAGASVGSATAGSMSETRFSVGSNLGPVVVSGDVSDTAIQAGGDLGSDAAPGGSGFSADRVGTGNIESVTITGQFPRSSIIAGGLRGPDGFFGTPDDSVAPGRSTIGPVTIGGTQVGSNLNTEQYRIYATGTIGAVLIGGQAPTNAGNFKVATLATDPTPIRVVDLVVNVDGNTWTATFFFNQAMDVSTIGPALTITELRDSGQTSVPIVQGTDYTFLPYDPTNNSITVVFSRTVTDRPLVIQGQTPPPGGSVPGAPDPSLPGPGVFHFVLDPAVLRAQVADARLDGDSNGFSTGTDETYAQNEVVGDAGDKITPEVINASSDPQNPYLVNMYGPADLNLVLDNGLNPDGLPEINKSFTLHGAIGDHPNNDVNLFRVGGDTDVYKITLLAGQILQLGRMQGSAQFAQRFLFNAAGDFQGGKTADSVALPVQPAAVDELTSDESFLIKTTGVYYIIITNANGFPNPGEIPDVPAGGGATGDYNFTISVFDDGDSGFAAPTNSGNGNNVVDAPAPIVFAGPNGVFQNPGDPGYDDLAVKVIGNFKFFLDPGADGVRGTADDTVTGSDDAGITSTRSGNNLSTTINSAIGPTGHFGVPGDVSSDVDIYNLNNGQPIAAGKRITIKIKLADLGADLGSFDSDTFTDFRGSVQFGVFDTTGATGADDGLLVLSPTDFQPFAGKPGELARQGQSAYGYDANGDFFITFVTPGRIGGQPGEAAKYAIYLQGVFNTDYTIQVTQTDNTSFPTVPQTTQNIFLETRGGTINWLEAGGLATKLAPFASSVLGFNGSVGGMPVDQYILTHLVSTLTSIFANTGLNVNFSTNPNAFEFQDFSTVFITPSDDPISILNTGNYGYSQHSDPFNLDRNDEGVVFMPSMADLGYTPSQADVDNFVLSLAAAVGRRAGELMGLRLTDNSSVFDNPIDIMSANSVSNVPGAGNSYAYVNEARDLSYGNSNIPDTSFFLGRQNAFALLDKFLTP